MILDNNHEMKIVIIEDRNGILGEVFEDFREFKSKHPYSGYKFGFCVVTKEGNYVPEGLATGMIVQKRRYRTTLIMHGGNKTHFVEANTC